MEEEKWALIHSGAYIGYLIEVTYRNDYIVQGRMNNVNTGKRDIIRTIDRSFVDFLYVDKYGSLIIPKNVLLKL